MVINSVSILKSNSGPPSRVLRMLLRMTRSSDDPRRPKEEFPSMFHHDLARQHQTSKELPRFRTAEPEIVVHSLKPHRRDTARPHAGRSQTETETACAGHLFVLTIRSCGYRTPSWRPAKRD